MGENLEKKGRVTFGGLYLEVKDVARPKREVLQQIKEIVLSYPDSETLYKALKDGGVPQKHADYLVRLLGFDKQVYKKESESPLIRMQNATSLLRANLGERPELEAWPGSINEGSFPGDVGRPDKRLRPDQIGNG